MLAWVAVYILATEVLLHVYMYVSINNNRSWDLIRGETMPGWEVFFFLYHKCVCVYVYKYICVCIYVCVYVCVYTIFGGT